MAKPVPRDVHAQCYKWSQLLHNHYLQNMGQEREGVGQESLTTAVLANLLFSYTLPLFDLIKSQRRFHILELEVPKEQNWDSKSRVQ